MPSSTFSSRERTVDGPWGLTWGLAALLIVVILGALEMRLRNQGYMPSASIDRELWSVQRHKVYWPDKTPVVLLGASRMSAGFSPRVFNDEYPEYRAIMLARAGRAAAATLNDLADDEDFKEGVVVFSMAPEHMTKVRRSEQSWLVRAHRQLTENYGFLNRFANRQIQAHIEDTFAFRGSLIDLEQWMTAEMGSGEHPEPHYLRAHADTSRSLDYSKKDVVAHRAKRLRKHRKALRRRPAPEPTRWLEEAGYAINAIDRLLDRGIQVVIVRYPTTGELHDLEQEHYPRDEYWDAFAKHTRAKMIHFEDYETLSSYECPDGSHLNFEDVPEFTRALGTVMEEHGVFETN